MMGVRKTTKNTYSKLFVHSFCKDQCVLIYIYIYLFPFNPCFEQLTTQVKGGHLKLLGGSESGGTNKIVRTCAAHLSIETDVK